MKLYIATAGLCCALLANTLTAQTPAPSASPSASPAASASPSPTPNPFADLKLKQEKLTIENGIAEQELKKSLAGLAAEKQRLELENSVAQQKLQGELAALQSQIEKLNKQSDLLQKQLAYKDAERKTKLDAELAELRQKLEKSRAENDLATAEAAAKARELQARDQDVQLKTKELQLARAEFEMKLAKLNSEIDLREKRDQWKNRVDREIAYTQAPFKDGVLTVSDRRIALNGIILMDTADYIAERIDYFNNQNQEYPIFIVIDRSPGGSVMAGYKILKAMEGSPAPVYVVVKSFAASMAAGITTLSKHSYAYPNAIILHHQMLSGVFGNITEQKENIKEMEEWWNRLATPVAKKMGMSLDDFIKEMYRNRITGDWREFADKAKKLKWVDDVVETVREESLNKNPDVFGAPYRTASPFPLMKEEVDGNGKHFILLPKPAPLDFYYLYNPDNYYRTAQ